MPELPEVHTTTEGLKKKILGYTIVSLWTDIAKKGQKIKHFRDTIKDLGFFEKIKKETMSQKVTKIERRAKNILIHLTNKKTILIHMKMTGHVLVGKYDYDKKNNLWIPISPKSLFDPYNRFIHFMIELKKNDKTIFMALCDSRKFAKVTMIDSLDKESKHLKNIGPEPLGKDFLLEDFKKCLAKGKNKKIKTVLMDQSIISGIGNIYSDEMLWLSSIHPESQTLNIPQKSVSLLFDSMKKVLFSGIDFGGDSMSDYRNVDGERGNFQNEHNVYRKNKQKCSFPKCKGEIARKVIGGRSGHFCNNHQALY